MIIEKKMVKEMYLQSCGIRKLTTNSIAFLKNGYLLPKLALSQVFI